MIVPGKIEDFLAQNKAKLKTTKLVVYVQPFESLFFMCNGHYGLEMADYNDPSRLFLKIRGVCKHFDPNVIWKYYPGHNGNFIREFYDKHPYIPETNYYELLTFYVYMEKYIKDNPNNALGVLKQYLPNTTSETLMKDFNVLMREKFVKFNPWSKRHFDEMQ